MANVLHREKHKMCESHWPAHLGHLRSLCCVLPFALAGDRMFAMSPSEPLLTSFQVSAAIRSSLLTLSFYFTFNMPFKEERPLIFKMISKFIFLSNLSFFKNWFF